MALDQTPLLEENLNKNAMKQFKTSSTKQKVVV